MQRICKEQRRIATKEKKMSQDLSIANNTIQKWGLLLIRNGLALVLLWIGILKFTDYEANGIQPLVANSPVLSWVYPLTGVQSFSRGLGVIEILLGLLIASRPLSARAAAWGSIGAIITFLITLTLLFSTPGILQPGYGFPFISPMPGQFLLKDIVLLGASVWTAGEAMTANKKSSPL